VTEPETNDTRTMKSQGTQNTRVLRSADLLGQGKEVVIDHDGERYLLRFTSKGKLILTK
jgi:hemin uptake protein HemP